MFENLINNWLGSGAIGGIFWVCFAVLFLKYWRFCSLPCRGFGNALPEQSEAFKKSMHSESGQATIFEGTSHINASNVVGSSKKYV